MSDSPYYEPARLAGLDAMVLHINNQPSNDNADTLDGIPYVKVSRANTNVRIKRSPLGDKTFDFNLQNQTNNTPSYRTTPSTKSSLSTDQDSAKEYRQSISHYTKYLHTRSSSFKPLPPVPSASSLQWPPFLDFSFHSIAPLPAPASQPFTPTLSPPVLPLRAVRDPHSELIAPQGQIETRTRRVVHDEPYLIPAFQHPNSPYVPWLQPIRRRILRPLSSGSQTSAHSSVDPRPYDRSGAKAPEPGEFSPIQTSTCNQLHQVARSFRGFRRAVKNNVKHAAKRVIEIKKKFKHGTATVHTPTCSSQHNSVHSTSPEIIFSEPEGMLSSIVPATLLSTNHVNLSTISLRSSDSATLTAWLASRRRASLERDYEPESMMTLDEYELKGSWLDLSTADEYGTTSSCGVPGCAMHAKDTSISLLSSDRQKASLAEDVGDDFPSPGIYETPSQDMLSASPLGSQQQVSRRRYSFPNLPSRSMWFDSQECLARNSIPYHGGGSVGELLSPLPFGRKEREMSMPGGWTFPS